VQKSIFLTEFAGDSRINGLLVAKRYGETHPRITAEGAAIWLTADAAARGIVVRTQPIREDSDFTLPLGRSPGELGACRAADYSAALEFGSFATPRRVC
jgi:hypothetical protein